ncbi:NmrA domain-containing protein [Mycena kentingensis (nom. inval.)]|nr:NmrA domain-containing protein [Mycena kentingensis (nom. inval.)]
MSPKFDNVIVFGPTGAVGGSVVLEASSRGAKVWLAMRDTTKAIPRLDVAAGLGDLPRVRADLSDPASVTAAIQTSNAKAAFVYLVFGAPDQCAASVKAMRAAGVEHVVFLSSYTVSMAQDPRTIPPEKWMPYAHAQVEIALEDAGFPTAVALRPSWFASNFFTIFLDRSVSPPKGTLVYEDSVTDNGTPEDIGAVGGALLVEPPADTSGRRIVYLFGRENKTFKESWELVKKITGRSDIDTSVISPEDLIAGMMQKGFPEALAKNIVESMEHTRGGYPEEIYKPNAQNVKKYTGREPMPFEEWLEKHKGDI